MPFTVAGMLGEIAQRTPAATALAYGEELVTFADLQDRGARLAQVLADLGIDGRVGFLGTNAPVFFELVLACSLRDAVLVGLNWRLAPGELEAIVEDAELSVVIAAPEQADLLAGSVERRGLRIVTTGPELEALVAAVDSTPVPCDTSAESVLLQLYSSGTTGPPKGVLITNENLSYTPISARRLYGMDADSVNLVASPLFHIGGAGYGMAAMSQGGTTVLVTDSHPATLLRAIERHRVTHAFLVPAVIQALIRAPELAGTDLSSLQAVAYGGAPMGEALLTSAITALGCDFIGVYGMTEACGTVVALPAADHDPGGPRAHLLRSIGRALPWACEVELRDPATHEPVAVGQVGEICLRSGQVSSGYWRQPDATAEARTEDGWLRTGDAAYADADGYLFLHDRIKDVVITGGENVYPAEVENVLAHHPAVADVAVIGIPSRRWGESVKALVVVEPGIEFCVDELIAFARERLAHYKCPQSVEVVAVLPRNAAGKVFKQELREGHGRGAP